MDLDSYCDVHLSLIALVSRPYCTLIALLSSFIVALYGLSTLLIVLFHRLTPPYMLVMMVYVPLFKYWGSGPMWPVNGIERNYCEDSWWTNLLYINNLVRVDKMVKPQRIFLIHLYP